MAGSRLVAYSYGDPTWTGSANDPATATAVLTVLELGAGYATVQTKAVLPFYAPEDATDQLRAFAAALNADPGTAGVYELAYDPAARAVTIRTTNGIQFMPYGPNSMQTWTGIQNPGDWETSFTGTSAPAAVVELYGVTVSTVTDAARVQLADYRLGRSISIAFGNHKTYQITLYIRSQDKRVFDTGYCLSGKVRIVQDSANTAPYSVTNPGGYVEGFVVSMQNLAEDGDLGEMWTCDLLIAAERG